MECVTYWHSNKEVCELKTWKKIFPVDKRWRERGRYQWAARHKYKWFLNRLFLCLHDYLLHLVPCGWSWVPAPIQRRQGIRRTHFNLIRFIDSLLISLLNSGILTVFFTAPVLSSVLTYIFINFYLNSFQETNKLFLALEHLKCIHVPALQHGMSRQVTQGHKSFTNIFFFLFIFFIVNPFICSI